MRWPQAPWPPTQRCEPSLGPASRRLGKANHGGVIEGANNIGSVCPDANLKLYLTAATNVRANAGTRRWPISPTRRWPLLAEHDALDQVGCTRRCEGRRHDGQ